MKARKVGLLTGSSGKTLSVLNQYEGLIWNGLPEKKHFIHAISEINELMLIFRTEGHKIRVLQKKPEISDSILIPAVRKGDRHAFDQLFRKYSSALYSFVFSIIKDEPGSEEIVQDTFLKIWEKRNELQTGFSFKSYLFTIAVNAAKKGYRKKLRENKYKQELATELGHNGSTDLSVIEYRSLLDYVNRIIERLPPARREIFIMSRKEGLQNAAIAEILNISEQTVKNQLVSAHKFMMAEAKKSRSELGFLFFCLFCRFRF